MYFSKCQYHGYAAPKFLKPQPIVLSLAALQEFYSFVSCNWREMNEIGLVLVIIMLNALYKKCCSMIRAIQRGSVQLNLKYRYPNKVEMLLEDN